MAKGDDLSYISLKKVRAGTEAETAEKGLLLLAPWLPSLYNSESPAQDGRKEEEEEEEEVVL